MLYRFIAILLRFVFATFYRWRVAGLERVPAEGGCVVVANHCNFFDPMVLGAALLPRRIVRFMAKAEVFTWPILGRLARWLYAFPVRRGVADRQAINTALAVVREGHVLGLFPEGTRHRDGRLHELRGGAAMVHLATGAPVIPVGLAGTEKLKPFRFPRLAVWVGEPLSLPNVGRMAEREAIAAVNAAIRAGLEDCMRRARGALNPSRPREALGV